MKNRQSFRPPRKVSFTVERRSRKWLVLSCAGFLFFLYCFFSTGRVRTRDEFMTALQTESLVLFGSTAVPQAPGTHFYYGRIDRFGAPRAPYLPGQALASLPFYLVGRSLSQHVASIPQRSRRIVCDFFQVLSSALFAAIAAASILLLLLKIGLDVRTALAAAVTAALATPLACYAGWFYSEPLACALLMGALLALLSKRSSSEISWLSSCVGGLLLGGMIWVRATHIIAVAVLLIGILVQYRGSSGWRMATVVASIVGLFALALLWRNHHLYGSFFDFGYPSAVDGKEGVNSFRGSFFKGFAGFLFSPGKSIFVFSPTIILSVLGLPSLWRFSKGLTIVVSGLPIVYLLFFSKFMQWEGGYCYGPRYLVPALVVATLSLGPYFAQPGRLRRISAYFLFSCGFLVEFLGLAVNYLQTEFNGTYYDRLYNYQFGFWGPLAQAKLLIHCILNHAPGSLGNGFDRWWIFLAGAGIPMRVTYSFGLVLLAGMAFTAWILSRTLEQCIMPNDPPKCRAKYSPERTSKHGVQPGQ